MTRNFGGAANGNENKNMVISRCEIEYICRQFTAIVVTPQTNSHESGRG